MNYDVQKFIVKQINNSCENADEKTKLFLTFLETLCMASPTKQEFSSIMFELKKISSDDYLDAADLENALHIEVFIKELYFLLHNERQGSFSKAMVGCGLFPHQRLNYEGNFIFSTKDELKDKPYYYKKIFNPSSSEYHFASAYKVRNIVCHTLQGFSLLERAQYCEDVLITFVESTWINRGKVKSYIQNIQLNLDNYFSNLKNEYMKKRDYHAYIPAIGKVRRRGDRVESEKSEDIFKFYNESYKYKRMRVIGSAGMGKTTLVRELAQRDIRNYDSRNKIPVIVELINFTDKSVSLEQQIATILNTSQEIVVDLLLQGSLNVYLDGINEISLEHGELKNVIHQIDMFISKYNKSFILLTDRENNYMEIMNDEQTYYVLPMDNQQIEDFINKNFVVGKTKETYNSLIGLLDENKDIRESARVPFMLHSLIKIAETGVALPKNHMDITKCLLESIFKREIREKKDMHASDSQYFLCEIAALMPEKKGMNEDDVRNCIVRVINNKSLSELPNEAGDILKLFIQLGILAKINNEIFFAQPTYKDYYFCLAFQDGAKNG